VLVERFSRAFLDFSQLSGSLSPLVLHIDRSCFTFLFLLLGLSCFFRFFFSSVDALMSSEEKQAASWSALFFPPFLYVGLTFPF
jgi:hypothetical protein